MLLRPVTSTDEDGLRTLVAQLSSEGSSAPAIASAIGLPVKAVRLLLRPACPRCSSPMSGRGDVCRGCSNGARRKWNRQEMLDARDEWAGLHGKPPSSYDWAPHHAAEHGRWAPGRWPGMSTVQRAFGTWAAFLAAPHATAGEGEDIAAPSPPAA